MNEGTGMLKAGVIELQQEFIPPHMVQIPLEEYRRYIEATIKGSTVEIPLEEYSRLKEENTRLRGNIIGLEFENKDFMEEINRRAELKTVVQQETGRITELLKTLLLKVSFVPDSVTRNAEKKESEVARNGRI